MTIKFQSTPFARRETTAPIIQNTGGFVSIHSLRKKGDPPPENLYLHNDPFQSTPFARRETKQSLTIDSDGIVSIHSLRKKGDDMTIGSDGKPVLFQSTPFARRETAICGPGIGPRRVSIHSLRKKGDICPKCGEKIWLCFNPLPSQEGRPGHCLCRGADASFQSTPFARRETPVLIYWNGSFLVSIHSLRKKGDDCRRQQRHR